MIEKDIDNVEKMFKSVIDDFSVVSNNYFFMSESDLVCTAYTHLMEFTKFYDYEKIKGKKINIHKVYTEIQIGNDGEKGFKCDIVIIDPNEIIIKDKEFGLKDNHSKNSIFIEFKHSWGKSQKKIISEMEKDYNKLNQLVPKAKKYVFYLDNNKGLKNFDLIKDKFVKEAIVIYVYKENISDKQAKVKVWTNNQREKERLEKYFNSDK